MSVDVVVRGLGHRYGDGRFALQDIDFHLPAGTSAAITGPSGSGKSTLVAVLAGLMRPTMGEVLVGDVDLARLSARRAAAVRADRLAVVVQNPSRNLLPYGSALDNLRFAARAARGRRIPSQELLLHGLGLQRVAQTPVDQLSGGERQRVALATGLATAPSVLLLDEPTSQLDTASRDDVMRTVLELARAMRTTMVIVTHDAEVARQTDVQLQLVDGRLATP